MLQFNGRYFVNAPVLSLYPFRDTMVVPWALSLTGDCFASHRHHQLLSVLHVSVQLRRNVIPLRTPYFEKSGHATSKDVPILHAGPELQHNFDQKTLTWVKQWSYLGCCGSFSSHMMLFIICSCFVLKPTTSEAYGRFSSGSEYIIKGDHLKHSLEYDHIPNRNRWLMNEIGINAKSTFTLNGQWWFEQSVVNKSHTVV